MQVHLEQGRSRGSFSEEDLWEYVQQFQNHVFYTATGLPFTYTIKTGRNGQYTKELLVDRRKESKTLTWSSIRLAWKKALEARSDPERPALFARPKAIGDIRSISYIYPLFWAFGIIDVPEDLAEKMSGHD